MEVNPPGPKRARWREPVPKTETAAKKLAVKGRALLRKYHTERAKSE
jgi:hypothetical protein